jgi:hypothetical protein
VWASGRFVAKAVERVLAKELRGQGYFEKQHSPGGQCSFILLHFLDHRGDTAPCRGADIVALFSGGRLLA